MMHVHRHLALFAALMTSLVAGSNARAQDAVDPAAIAALEEMGAFLRAQPSMRVRSETATDEILFDGQKIMLHTTTDMRVRRPDNLRVRVDSDRKSRDFIYDGETFTVFAERSGYYASVSAPPTLRELAAVAASDYGVELPLADLFYWGTPHSDVDQIQSAINVGPSKIDGVECNHFAFRQPSLDWQIWIEADRPVPRKLVLTTTTEPEQPQHVIEMSWEFDPLLDSSDFEFEPPPGAHRIPIVRRVPAPS